MGIPGREIYGKVYVHHMNPLTVDDLNNKDYLLNPEYLVCVSHDTHNAIHYGYDNSEINNKYIERKPNDTCPWKN